MNESTNYRKRVRIREKEPLETGLKTEKDQTGGKNDEESYRALKCKRYRGLEDDRGVKSWRNNYINLSHHDG